MRFAGVIPARYGSVRLPGKALIPIAGRTLIEWVYVRAVQAPSLAEVWIATDDERIRRAAEDFKAPVIMTRADHASGTDRAAEAARRIDADAIVNVQGDEPLMAPETIEAICGLLRADSDLEVATACVAIDDPYELESPDTVKVVADRTGRVLYFSRACIPHRRRPGRVFKHLGIYGYRMSFLERLHRLRPSPLEKTESLEQLRFLENGVRIQLQEVQDDSPGIDNAEDLARVRPLLENLAPLVPPRRTERTGVS